MSLEGTAAGLVAAFGLAAIARGARLIPAQRDPGSRRRRRLLGALVESALGATLEGPGILNNDMLNFINTAVAAAAAVCVALRSEPRAARLTSISAGRSRWSRRRSASSPARSRQSARRRAKRGLRALLARARDRLG